MNITATIKKGIINELKELFKGRVEYILYKNMFEKNEKNNYTLPLILFEGYNTGEGKSLPSGMTEINFDFNLYVYSYELNPELTTDNDYSLSTEDIFDEIRQHFSKKIFLSADMQNICNNYSFNYAFLGSENDNSQENCIGMILKYSAISYDNTTLSNPESENTLLYVKEI